MIDRPNQKTQEGMPMSDSSEAADLVRRLNAGLNAGQVSRRTVLRGMVFGGAMVAGGGVHNFR